MTALLKGQLFCIH